jgi:hypothetical protein
MKQLRITTTSPHSMFSSSDELRTELPTEIGEITGELKNKGASAYIDGEAESLAGFDIPVILDGDIGQVDLPIAEQDIVMLIDGVAHKLVAILHNNWCNEPQYLFRLPTEDLSTE